MRDLLQTFRARGEGRQLKAPRPAPTQKAQPEPGRTNPGPLKYYRLDNGTTATTRTVMDRAGVSYQTAYKRLRESSNPAVVYARPWDHPGCRGRLFVTSEGPRRVVDMVRDARNLPGYSKHTLRYRCIAYGPGIPPAVLYGPKHNGRPLRGQEIGNEN